MLLAVSKQNQRAAQPPPARRLVGLVYLLLALGTLAVYWRVGGFEFINFDDGAYVARNPQVQGGLTLKGVAWAFTSGGYQGNWHPLTWLSHMLDCQLFGLHAGAHHLVNVALHLANTLLLFGVLRRMTGALWRSAVVAALFAWHPLHVESVAWVAERKDVLSGLFWMLTLAAYLRYAERPGWGRYLPVVGCFALGLMAKPMLVTLPCVLLLLDYWPLGRWQPAGPASRFPGILPKTQMTPPAARSAGVLTRSSSNSHSGREKHAGILWPLRFRPAGVAAAGEDTRAPGIGQQAFPPAPLKWLVLEKLPLVLLAAAGSVVTYLCQQKAGTVETLDYLPVSTRVANALVAYARYLGKTFWPADLAVFYPLPHAWPAWAVAGSIILLLGLSLTAIWRGRQRAYLLVGWLWFLGTLVPVIGLVQVGMQSMADRYTYLPLIGIFVGIVWAAAEAMAGASRRVAAGVMGAMLVLACLAGAWRQVGYWRNSVTLFERTLAVTGGTPLAHLALGMALKDQGKPQEAMPHLREALVQAPDLFLKTFRVQTGDANAYYSLGIILTALGKTQAAMTNYQAALAANPTNAPAHLELGRLLMAQQRAGAAIPHFEAALRLSPTNGEARLQLAMALDARHRDAEAIPLYREVLRVNPDQLQTLNNLAILLATHPQAELRNGAEAVELAKRACELTRGANPVFLGTLAAAYAEAGQFPEAIKTAQTAYNLASRSGPPDLIATLAAHLRLYQAGQPCREAF